VIKEAAKKDDRPGLVLSLLHDYTNGGCVKQYKYKGGIWFGDSSGDGDRGWN